MRKSGIQAFISYRRSTGREVARNIYERLSLKGINTFFDYNSLRNGKFNEQIYDAIEQADDFILILSKNALDRCNNPGDWVRTEIEHALKFNKNIIIVNTEPVVSFPTDLPESLRDLPSYLCISLNQEYYEESIARLIKMLSENDGRTFNIKKTILTHWRIIAMICAVCAIAFIVMFFYIFKTSDKHSYANAVGLTAKIYLPRYADIDREILDLPWFTTDAKRDFEYIDTIINEQYAIYPYSGFFSNNVQNSITILEGYKPTYHNLPLRLAIHNTKTNTQVINGAQLEILDIHPISSPFITIYKSLDSLKFVSQIPSISPRYTLSYSLLGKGESFTGFKKIESISTSTHNVTIGRSDSIHGSITSDSHKWIFDYSFAKNKITDTIDADIQFSEISPESSNVKVYTVDIENMETPRLYPISGISRQIVKGEVDDDVYIILRSDMSFDARLRVRIVTVTNKEVFTEPIDVRYINPMFYENKPF